MKSKRLVSGIGHTLVVACVLLCAWSATAFSHEIPNNVTVRLFLKPHDNRLNVLVRVPLEAMRDFNWPTRGPGYLELSRLDSLLRDATQIWITDNLEIYQEGERLLSPRILAQRIALPSDRSFASYPEAVAHLRGPPLGKETQIFWQQALLDVHLEYAISSSESQFAIRPDFSRLGLRVTTALLFLPASGTERAFEFSGDPGVVELDPRWHQAVRQFVKLGFLHILDGLDHLLFLLCLVVPVRQFRTLILVVTSFTLAHSVTLLAAAFGLTPVGLWFPPLIETLIALSILYMAIENVVARHPHRRWMLAFGFGLVHGFGFSFALQETLQFAGRHLITSLFSFNLGVELGQLLVIAVFVPSLNLVFRFVDGKMGTIILSLLVGHTAWHWMVERGSTLQEYRWPEWNAANLAAGTRWLMLGVAVIGFLWLAGLIQKQFQLGVSESGDPEEMRLQRTSSQASGRS